MKLGTLLLTLFVFLGLVAPGISAAPVVNQVLNAASNIDPRMPNAALAPGSIFIVKGTGLGPAQISIAPSAFQSTTLSGTSVKLTVSGTTVDALMYYTSANQIAALLPSNTPAGGGTITVTYNGDSSPSTPFRGVVARNLALFTVDSTGTGPAIVTYPDYSLVSPSRAANCGGPNTVCGAANPGDVLILWGTGLGAISGNDASGAGLGVNMPNIPLNVWLGGVQATVSYQGRSGCCIGEDQIVFTVPNNVPTGCGVPLVVQIGNQVSNSTGMAIANGSRTCSDPSLPGVDVSQFSSLTTLTLASVELDHFLIDTSNPGNGFVDKAQSLFVRFPLPPASRPFFASYVSDQPIGTCTVFGSKSPGDLFFNNLINDAMNNGTFAFLDGGTSFTITGPNGSKNVQINNGSSTTISQNGAFLTPGDYAFVGNGGNDIGPFTAHITIPATPTLTKPSSPNGLIITRSQGTTVTWDATGATGHVEIIISVFLDQNTLAQAWCTVQANAGTFTIPAYVLLALPPATNGGASFFFGPGDQGPAYSGVFTANGLTNGIGIAQAFLDGVISGGVTLN
jgi:uncharacterized protein (TIGR03437 family)